MYSSLIIGCLYFAQNLGLWYDELEWSLRIVYKKSILETLQHLAQTAYNLPLFYIVINTIYKFSANTLLLRLPTIISVILGIYITQKFVNKWYGKKFGIWVPFLFLFTPIFQHIATNIRPYGFLFLFSSYSFYLYYKRLHNETHKNIIKLGIVFSFLAYTHWYATLLISTFALTDLYLWLKRKISFKCIISYIICFITFFPWLICVLLEHKFSLINYWGISPKIGDVLRIFYCLGNNSIFMLSFFLLSIAYSLIMITKTSKLKNITVINPINHIVFIIGFICFIPWGYAQINPAGSLWEIRYFFVFLPQLIVLPIICIYDIILNKRILKIKELFNKNFTFWTTMTGLFIFIFYIAIFETNKHPIRVEFRNFEQYLQILHRLENQPNKSSLVLSHHPYFFEHYTKELPPIDMGYIKSYDHYIARKKRMNPYSIYTCIYNKTCEQAVTCLSEKYSLHFYSQQKKQSKLISQKLFPAICKYKKIYLQKRDIPIDLMVFFDYYYTSIPFLGHKTLDNVNLLIQKNK